MLRKFRPTFLEMKLFSRGDTCHLQTIEEILREISLYTMIANDIYLYGLGRHALFLK